VFLAAEPNNKTFLKVSLFDRQSMTNDFAVFIAVSLVTIILIDL